MPIFFLFTRHLKLMLAVAFIFSFTIFGNFSFTNSLQAQSLFEDQVELVPNEIIIWYQSTPSINKIQAEQNLAAITSAYKNAFPLTATSLATTKQIALWQFDTPIPQSQLTQLLQELNTQPNIVAFQNTRIKLPALNPSLLTPQPDAQKNQANQPNVANTPNDSFFNLQYALNNTGVFEGGSTFDADIDGLEAWNTTPGSTSTACLVLK